MDLGGSVWRVLKGFGMWLYCWLRIVLYWLAKVAGNSWIGFRSWLKKSGEKKAFLKLGRAVYQLHLDGKTDWSDDSRVKEFIQEQENCDRQMVELKGRLQEREERYREQVKRIKEAKSSGPTKGEEEGAADSG